MAAYVSKDLFWRFSKWFIKYILFWILAICAFLGALQIAGLIFFWGSVDNCTGINAYQIGDRCFYD